MTMNSTFDFVIVGAGTAGCVLANRLSEDSEVSVLFLEAGSNKIHDARLSTPGGASATYGNPEFDWAFTSMPQKCLNGKTIAYPRGKTVGGSSAINILALAYPNKAIIDAWGTLGNEDWSWEHLAPYYQKFQTHHPPTEEAKQALGLDYTDKATQGFSGPIHSSYPSFVSPLSKAWIQTLKNLGWPGSNDPVSTSAIGGFSQPYTVDPATVTRSHAGTAYYEPVAHRSNLHLETEAQVTRIVFNHARGLPRASGVTYMQQGSNKVAHARKEVILAAGTFHTAQILELSGIGSKDLLAKFDVPSLVDNPGVGENMQDHAMSGVCAQVRQGVSTGDLRRDPAFLAKAKAMYENERSGPLTMGFPSFAFLPLHGWADEEGFHDLLSEQIEGPPEGDMRPSRSKQQDILRQIVLSPHEASVQLNLGPAQMHFDKSTYQDVFSVTQPENFMTIMAVLPHPFSAGTCHIKSADPKVLPQVDPRFMSHTLDVDLLARHVGALEKMLETAPLADLIEPKGRRLPEASPLFSAESKEKQLAAGREHVQRYIRSMSHPTGTASMLPRDQGGVVDPKLLVYGVERLRVVDASIFPMVPKGNIQSTVYAVAERAADFVKACWNLAS